MINFLEVNCCHVAHLRYVSTDNIGIAASVEWKDQSNVKMFKVSLSLAF